MRKYLWLAAVLFLSYSAVLYAAPVGNPTKLSGGSQGLYPGYEGGYVFDRDLDRGNDELERAQDHYAKISYVFDNPMKVYGLVGGTKFRVTQDGDSYYRTEFGLGYGGGMKGRLWQNDQGTALGYDAKYRRSQPDVDQAVLNGSSVRMEEVTYQDWQTALGISQKMGGVEPYVGVKYNDVDIDDTGKFPQQNSEHVIGPFAGLDIPASKDVVLNVEGHLVTETALTGGLTMRF